MADLFGFGHPIVSDMPVTGALSGAGLASAAALPLSITLAPPQPGTDCPLYCRDGGALVFTAPGIGQYRCQPGSITVIPEPACNRSDLSNLLIATALPAMQWLRGHFMLHAAAVVLPGRSGAIALCGVSTSGKSTSAAALLERGASLLADDSLRLARHGDEWRGAGLPGGLFQTSPAAHERHFMPVPADRAVAEAPLDAIVVLGARLPAPVIRRLDAVEAAGQLLAQQHRPRIPAFLGQRGAVLQMVSEIVRAVPVFVWHRGDDGAGIGPDEWQMLLHCGSA